MTAIPVLADVILPARPPASPRRASRVDGGSSAANAAASPLASVTARARSWAREVALVLGATLFLALAAQVVIPLPFTPVPLSLSTFAVILSGAALGPSRGFATTAAYLALGLAGAPVFASAGSGWAFASFGFVLGYMPAAWLMGMGARRGADRKLGTMLLAALAGSAVIYAVGVGWLLAFLDVGLTDGLRMGVLPFLPGDALKIAAATLALPASWRLVNRFRRP